MGWSEPTPWEIKREPERAFTDKCNAGANGRPGKTNRRISSMMDRFYAWATALIVESKNETGQTFVEYALVLSVIVVGVLLAATWSGPRRPPSQGAITTVTGAF